MATTLAPKTDRDYIAEELTEAVSITLTDDPSTGFRGCDFQDVVTIDDPGVDDIPVRLYGTKEVDGETVDLVFELKSFDGSSLVYGVEVR